MKKVILKENQIKRLIDKMLTENINDKFRKDVKITFYVPQNVKYNNQEINDISPIEYAVFYDMDVEYRNYGIKSIYVTAITGSKTIETEIEYYDPQTDETKNDLINIELNWDNIIEEKDETLGWFGVGDEIEIELKNDEMGKLIVDKIKVPVRTF